MIRKIFFWLHLSAGAIAGVVIFIMCVTGVLLAYEKRMVHWADREFQHEPSPFQQQRASTEAMLAAVTSFRKAPPTSLTVRSDRNEPASAEYGRESVVYINPWTGEVLGEGSKTVRAFFRETENWHRWLAAGLKFRAAARGVTGASNLIFLGLCLSGIYLWLPKRWSVQHLRPIVWFKGGIVGKARDFNWHNTVGLWCVLPLVVVLGTGVVMSYPWANALVYKLTASEMPQGGSGAGGRQGERSRGEVSFEGIDALWRKAEIQTLDWKTISLRVPASPGGPVQFQIDRGSGGRPDLRGSLTLNRTTGEVVRWEPFSSNSPGRRLRTWIRFSHTGEVWGFPGETVAGVTSTGGAVLVYTGISLAIRRLSRALARRRRVAADIPAVSVRT